MKIEIEGTEEEVRSIAASIGSCNSGQQQFATVETVVEPVLQKEEEAVDAIGRKWKNKEEWKKKISIAMKELHRKKRVAREKSNGKSMKQSITDPVVEDRVPKAYSKNFYHKKHASPATHTAKPWSKEDEEKLKAFYFDPQNHFADGMMKGDAMEKFAESINRTKGAVKVHIINVGLNKKLVRDGKGFRKKVLTPEAVKMMHDYAVFGFKPVAEAKAKDIMEFFRHLTSQNGIEAHEEVTKLALNVSDWQAFCQMVLRKSSKMCEILNKPNRLQILRRGEETVIRYGDAA